MNLAFEANPPVPPFAKGGRRGDFAWVTAKLNRIEICAYVPFRISHPHPIPPPF